jgi:hypothetical protein
MNFARGAAAAAGMLVLAITVLAMPGPAGPSAAGGTAKAASRPAGHRPLKETDTRQKAASAERPHYVPPVGAAPAHEYVAASLEGLSTWQPATYFGISIDVQNDIWHSGHINAILPLSTGGYLLGTETGGAYLIGANFSFALSNAWDRPDINSMAFGIHDERQVFAAGSGLYVTDWQDPTPYFAWSPVDYSAILNPGIIEKVIVDRAHDALIIATQNRGVWWGQITFNPTQPVWHQAKGDWVGDCWGLALGPGGRVVVGTLRTYAKDPRKAIYYGDWVTKNGVTDLVMSKASIPGSVDPANTMFCTSVASERSDPNNMYAVGSDMRGGRSILGFVSKILKSVDGGKTWKETAYLIPGKPGGGGDIRDESGDQGTGYNNVIAVHPSDPHRVLIGWSLMSFWSPFYSYVWLPIDGDWFQDSQTLQWHTAAKDWNLHVDVHTIQFDPFTDYKLELGGDGGIAISLDGGDTLSTSLNQNLNNIQFYPDAFGVSEKVDGLVAGGTQDNGDCYTVAGANVPYQELDLGFDGSECRFIQSGQLVYDSFSVMAYGTWNGSQLTRIGPIPVTIPKPNDTEKPSLPTSLFEPVSQVNFGIYNFLVYGVAANGADIYELLGDSNGNQLQWRYTGNQLLAQDEYISTIGLEHLGIEGIYLGTNQGRIYRMDPLTGSSAAMIVAPPQNLLGDPVAGSILAIKFTATNDQGYALYNTAGGGYVLKSDSTFTVWSNYGSNVPTSDGQFTGLAVGGTVTGSQPSNVYLSSDANVYESTDAALTWSPKTAGLPTRAHVNWLQYVAQANGNAYLYASTYGRGIWRIQLGGS